MDFINSSSCGYEKGKKRFVFLVTSSDRYFQKECQPFFPSVL